MPGIKLPSPDHPLLDFDFAAHHPPAILFLRRLLAPTVICHPLPPAVSSFNHSPSFHSGVDHCETLALVVVLHSFCSASLVLAIVEQPRLHVSTFLPPAVVGLGSTPIDLAVGQRWATCGVHPPLTISRTLPSTVQLFLSVYDGQVDTSPTHTSLAPRGPPSPTDDSPTWYLLVHLAIYMGPVHWNDEEESCGWPGTNSDMPGFLDSVHVADDRDITTASANNGTKVTKVKNPKPCAIFAKSSAHWWRTAIHEAFISEHLPNSLVPRVTCYSVRPTTCLVTANSTPNYVRENKPAHLEPTVFDDLQQCLTRPDLVISPALAASAPGSSSA
ncbi:hypothetical protein LXA43DRAFT_1096412 [Ganoderma leucocontextum]|nr:hypothetical protein LXA43DRAFT_1096412 [Ganoderma leucocontextum]